MILRGIVEQVDVLTIQIGRICQGAGLTVNGVDVTSKPAGIGGAYPLAQADPAAEAQQQSVLDRRALGVSEFTTGLIHGGQGYGNGIHLKIKGTISDQTRSNTLK